jgi:heme A synthase
LVEEELRARRRTVRNLIVMLFATALLFMTVAVEIDVEYLSEWLGLIYGLMLAGAAIGAWRSHRAAATASQSRNARVEADSIPTHDPRIIEYTKDRAEEIVADVNILIFLFGAILVMSVITGVICRCCCRSR